MTSNKPAAVQWPRQLSQIAWKEKIQGSKGSTFSYPISIAAGVKTDYLVSVNEDGSCLTCEDCKKEFGDQFDSSEYHVYCHLVTHEKHSDPTRSLLTKKPQSSMNQFFPTKPKKPKTSTTTNKRLARELDFALDATDSGKSSLVSSVSPLIPSDDETTARTSISGKSSPATNNQACDASASSVSQLALSDNDMTTNTTSNPPSCNGYKPLLPQPMILNYPHRIGVVLPAVKDLFGFDSQSDCIRSVFCVVLQGVLGGEDRFVCQQCEDLKLNGVLENIVIRANDPDLYQRPVGDSYLTCSQLEQRLRFWRWKSKRSELDLLNRDHRIIHILNKIQDYKTLMVQISRTDDKAVPRVRQILARCLREGRGMKYLLDTFQKAIDRTYSPKVYTHQEVAMAVLTLRLGGRKLLYASSKHVDFGPSLRATKRIAKTEHYMTMASAIDYNIMKENFERFVFKRLDLEWNNESLATATDPGGARTAKKCLYVGMIDDVIGEKRVRIDDHDGCVRGLCYHAHLNNIDLEITCAHDCEFIKKSLEDSKVHYANQVTNFAIGPIRENDYSPRLVATSAGCQDQDPLERTLKILKTAMYIWSKDRRGQALRGIMSTIQSDGAGSFVKIGQILFFHSRMSKTHPLFSLLSPLKLMCLYSGTGIYERTTAGCDLKHVVKRIRERLKSTLGTRFGNVSFQGLLIRKLIHATRDSTRIRESEIEAMFATGYADAMHVPSAVNFIRCVGELGELTMADYKGLAPGFLLGFWKELKLLSRYCKLLFTLVADKRPSLGAQLQHISELMHIAFACHRRNGTNFMANQTYTNQQRFYRSIYWSVANCKVEHIDEYFMFQDSDDRLEVFYGLLRLGQGGALSSGSGMDVLQVGDRISGCMEVDSILTRYPELRQKSRHLATTTKTGSDDHQNPLSLLSDDVGGQDRSRVNVNAVNLTNRFMEGRDCARKVLKAAGFHDKEVNWDALAGSIAGSDDVDFLRPKGNFVGIGVVATDLDDEEDTNPDVSGDPSTEDDGVFIEEEMDPVPDESDTSETRPRPVLKIENMRSSRFLRIVLDGKRQSATETSRIARYQGSTKSGREIKEKRSDLEGSSSTIHAGETPIISLFKTTDGITLAIGMPYAFQIGHVKGLIEIPIGNLSLSETTIKCTLVSPRSMDDGTIQWDAGKNGVHHVQFQGSLCSAFNPELKVLGEKDGMPGIPDLIYSIDEKTLTKCFDVLRLQLEQEDGSQSAVLPQATGLGSILPYKNKVGKNLFIFKLDSEEAWQPQSSCATTVKGRSGVQTYRCGVRGCGQEFETKNARHHAAFHLLFDTDLAERVSLPVGSLCGLCACRESIMYCGALNATLARGCQVFVDKPKNWKKATVVCGVVGKQEITLASAKKSSTMAPSTNLPIVCPLCPRKPSPRPVWKHGMYHHWETCHNDNVMPDKLRKALYWDAVENDRIKKKFQFTKKSRKRQEGKAGGEATTKKKKSSEPGDTAEKNKSDDCDNVSIVCCESATKSSSSEPTTKKKKSSEPGDAAEKNKSDECDNVSVVGGESATTSSSSEPARKKKKSSEPGHEPGDDARIDRSDGDDEGIDNGGFFNKK